MPVVANGGLIRGGQCTRWLIASGHCQRLGVVQKGSKEHGQVLSQVLSQPLSQVVAIAPMR